MMNEQASNPIKILFSYTHEDEELRDKLEKHLSTLKRKNRIICWHDRDIRAGMSWNQSISTHLDAADIILLLVSPDFLASDYCNRVEVRRALERHRKGEACIIPIILRSVDWRDEEFAEIQALPRDAKPIMKWANIDDALLDVAKGLKKVIADLEASHISL